MLISAMVCILPSQQTILTTPNATDSSPRDDLESLAYTLLFLLRGGLPWQRYNSRGCTRFGAMKQIREKKMKWPGPRLGEGKPKDFGNLLDYARALAFEDKPDYKRLSKGFERLAGEPTEGLDFCECILLSALISFKLKSCSFDESNRNLQFTASRTLSRPRTGHRRRTCIYADPFSPQC